MVITVNGQKRQSEEGLTVIQLLGQLQLAGRPVAVELNLQLLPRRKHEETKLKDGDTLEIVSFVGGG